MLFSVIVPVYNVAEWLVECIESILKQTYSDYELILVDDGSTDESGKLCDEYAGKYSRIRVIHKKNGGLSEARNFGEEVAKGEYLLFVDSDDYIAEWALKKAAENIEKYHPEIIVPEGSFDVYDGGIVTNAPFKREIYDNKSGEEALLLSTKIGPNWGAWGKFFKRQFWQEKGYKFAVGCLAEDFQLIDRVILEAEKLCGMETFYYYRIRQNSLATSYNPKRIDDRWKHFADWSYYLKTHEMNPELKKQIYALHAKMIREILLQAVLEYKKEDVKRWTQEAKKYLYYFKYSDYWKDKCILYISQIVGLDCFIKVYCRLKGKKDV